MPAPDPVPTDAHPPAATGAGGPCTLGLDAGGTATRWALADAQGGIVAEGEGPALSGLMLLDDGAHAAVAATLRAIARALPRPPRAALAGVTGLDATTAPAFAQALAAALAIDAAAVTACGDIELLCRAAFPDAPGGRGTGIVLYAGTGAIAARLAADGTLERAGGRGHVIDDAGGGHWIAREALSRVWRAEDERPGAWQASPLARALFARIGGHDWPATRRFVYGQGAAGRGELGRLATAVAESADDDADARALLADAGRELARPVRALLQRCGAQPVVLAGRVFELHPAIEAALRDALPSGTTVARLRTPPHHAAARLAGVRAAPAEVAPGTATAVPLVNRSAA